jgi:hypothetical protein
LPGRPFNCFFRYQILPVSIGVQQCVLAQTVSHPLDALRVLVNRIHSFWGEDGPTVSARETQTLNDVPMRLFLG